MPTHSCCAVIRLRVGHPENVWQRKCHAVWLSMLMGTNRTPLSGWKPDTLTHTLSRKRRCTVCLEHKHFLS